MILLQTALQLLPKNYKMRQNKLLKKRFSTQKKFNGDYATSHGELRMMNNKVNSLAAILNFLTVAAKERDISAKEHTILMDSMMKKCRSNKMMIKIKIPRLLCSLFSFYTGNKKIALIKSHLKHYKNYMQIKLEYIVPLPLKDKLGNRKSDVWNKEIIFSPGELIKIKAPSGTGKTTLVHILYKLRNDYEGSVWYDSTEVKKISVNDIAAVRQKTFSIVFQDLRLFPNISARENIELKRVLQQPYYSSDIVDAMAERLNITHVLNQKSRHLQLRRAATYCHYTFAGAAFQLADNGRTFQPS